MKNKTVNEIDLLETTGGKCLGLMHKLENDWQDGPSYAWLQLAPSSKQCWRE